MQALRRDIIRRLQEELLREKEEQDLIDYKRSLSAWARWGTLAEKRNLEALARGGYIKTQPETQEDPNLKRSEATLENLSPPPFETEAKRGIQSLARNGDLNARRELDDLIDEYYGKQNSEISYEPYGKRYLGSLARNGDLYAYNTINKRNVASVARDGLKIGGKRNVAAMLRQDSYQNGVKQNNENNEDKRNLASVKAQFKQKFKRSTFGDYDARSKRQVDYYDGVSDEYPSPVYQNQNVYDYEELMKALTGVYPNIEKRFLGKFHLHVYKKYFLATFTSKIIFATKFNNVPTPYSFIKNLAI